MLEAALQQFTWEAGPSAPLQLGPGICNRLAQAAGQARVGLRVPWQKCKMQKCTT